MADAAELVEGTSQLGLEHDDDRDDDEEGRVAKQPGQQDEIERGGQHADDRQQDEADKDLNALRSAEQTQQLIEDERDDGHVDHLDRAEVADHLEQLQPELADEAHWLTPGARRAPSPKISAIRAICA